jgi:putative component of membrane protein insertase Oxa1/YidC/SpoIIIJ protein YidD
MRFIIYFLLLFPVVIFAQNDWHRWGKADISYQINSSYRERNYNIETNSFSDLVVSSVVNAYWIFFSDVDGDNCAFSPTCSSFFVEAVKETNIFQGVLMFADRLTRDTNFIGRESEYPIAKNGRLYDLPLNYKLDSKEIKYLSPYSSIKNE